MKRFALFAACACLALPTVSTRSAEPSGVLPTGADGKPLNLDFEQGTLTHWAAEGTAFNRQPVRGDTVAPRRGDMKSDHTGDYWIGSFEIAGDDPHGTLTSARFKVTHPFASFRIAGGDWPATRVELIRADTQQAFFKVSGLQTENLRPVVVDLQPHAGREIFIRLVDQQSGHWGHINFDDFKFHARKPVFSNALDPARLAVDVPPPADVVKFAGISGEEAARAITMPDGFKAMLFAGEPDIQQPIAFCLDDRGRVWVAEGHTYPRRAPEGQGRDRILIFEDTDGDGKFNKRTVFMENLNLVSGLEVGFGGVWIGAAPHLMFVADRNRDDKPDGEPEILLDGWDYLRDTHETLNTFTWGPDGWLYGCHGVFCPSFVGKPGTAATDRQRVDAAVWRYHPTKHRFEIFAEGTSNPWGIDFDEHGQCFIEACVIPHFWHMIQGGRYERQGGQHYNINAGETRDHARYHPQANTRHVHPFIFDDIKTSGDHVHYAGNKGPHAGNDRSDAAGGGHAHAGLMMYLGGSWPDEYRNRAFMNNIHGQRINMDIAERRGSGYVGKHGPDFLNFNDKWSQVLNLLYDQDGSVYMIDWYDKNQCHHNDVNGHDRSNGRIFKVVHGSTGFTRVDLHTKTDRELVELQLHRNDWYVRHARRILQERGGNAQVHQGLRAILETNPDVTRKLRALWALHVTGGLTGEVALAQLQSSHEYVRAWTIQLLAEDLNPPAAALQEFARLSREDSSAFVRLYLLAALQRTPVAQRWPILGSLQSRSEDAADHNIPLMTWFAMEPLISADMNQALDLALESKIPRILNFTTRRVAAMGTPEAYAAITERLQPLENESKQLEMLSGLSAALKGQRSVTMPRGWEAVERKLSSSANEEVRTLGQSLSLTFGSTQALASLRKTLADSSAEAGSRRTALESLLGVRDPELAPVLQSLLKDGALRAPALRALATYEDTRTPAAILEIYASLSAPEKRDALNTLSSRITFARPLLTAVGAGSVPSKDLTAEIVRQLRSLKDSGLELEIQKVWGLARDTSADKQKEIERFRGIYRAGGSQPGDAIRGRALFARACQQCHSLFDAGGKVGPDLTGSNRGDLDYILQNMVDPNAVIPNEYRSSTIETRDERVITGIVKQQDANAVTIVTANETIIVPRQEIRSLQQSDISMMPEGLLQEFRDQEVRDLIYYLGRPGQVPLMAAPETVGSFFNGKDLTGWDGDPNLWRVENGEIVGKTSTGLKQNEFLKGQMVLGDFRLTCLVKLTPNQENSGIQFRSETEPGGSVKGYQADIGAGWWGKLYEEHGRALLWDKSGEANVKIEDWNQYEIVAVGSQIRTFINGKPCVDLNDPKGAKQGIIAFQLHSGGPMEVRFKDFKIELNPKIDMATR